MTKLKSDHRPQRIVEVPGASPHATLAAAVLQQAYSDFSPTKFREYIQGPCGGFWCGAIGLSSEAVYEATTSLDRTIDYPPYKHRKCCGIKEKDPEGGKASYVCRICADNVI